MGAAKARGEQRARSGPTTRGRPAAAIGVALLMLLGATLLSTLPRKTLTNDELLHLPAGYLYLTRGDFRLNPEHPPLAKEWAALPLLALRPELPPTGADTSPGKHTADTARWFWEANGPRFDTLAFWGRVPMIALTLALGAALFATGRRLFGARAALLALALYCAEPTILAHGRIVHTDLPGALAYLVAWVALGAYVTHPAAGRAALVGLALGAALAIKHSLLILLPLAGVAFAVALRHAPRRGTTRRRIAAHGVLVATVALLVVNAAYGFQRAPLTPADHGVIAAGTPGHARLVTTALAALAGPLPTAYPYGLYTFWLNNRAGRPAALLGMHGTEGWWYYFPVAFALKTSVPILLTTAAGLAWALWRVVARRDWRCLACLAPALLYLAPALGGPINIGVRHILPIYPFLLLLCGAALDQLLRAGARAARRAPPLAVLWRASATAAVALTPGWAGLAAARAYPDFTGYLNELARPYPRWWYLSDSNVEWGDDVGALAAYLRARGETRVLAALSGGWATLPAYGVEYVDALAPGAPPPTRYVALGTSLLNGSLVPGAPAARAVDRFAAYRDRAPEAVFGGTIYLYRWRADPPPPAAPLPDGIFRPALTGRGAPARLGPGETVTIGVRVRNASDAAWPATAPGDARYQLRIGARWRGEGDGAVQSDAGRAPLPYALFPGEAAELLVTVAAPTMPGAYTLEIDLVQEGVAWAAERGGRPLRLRLLVAPH